MRTASTSGPSANRNKPFVVCLSLECRTTTGSTLERRRAAREAGGSQLFIGPNIYGAIRHLDHNAILLEKAALSDGWRRRRRRLGQLIADLLEILPHQPLDRV